MKLHELLLEYKLATDKDRRECTSCDGTFVPDNPKDNREKRCQACRLLGIQTGDEGKTADALTNSNVSKKSIDAFIEDLIDVDLTDTSKRDMTKMLKVIFGVLDTRQEQVLRLRFGLSKNKKELSLREIGEIMHISGSRVRDIEAKALRSLRHPRISKELKKIHN